MKKIQNILILAGGDSSRFWPLKNKNLTSFLGKPIIEYQITSLIEYAQNIHIIVNSNNQNQIVQLINQLYKKTNCKFHTIVQKENLQGMAGAVLSAKNKINGEVMIFNAEDIFSYKLVYQCINTIKEKKLDYFFVAKKVEKYFPGGYIKFQKSKVKEVIEKPGIGNEPSKIVKLTVDYFSDFSQLIDAIEKITNNNDDQYERAINLLLNQNINVDYILYNDYWYTIKYPWHILPMMKYYLSTIKQNIIGKNVVISKTAIIKGPCYIGSGTIIGDFALVRESHIGANCLIGAYSEVARSYLSDNVMLHRNYVGDSVLGENVLLGSGATTANFRFDEKNILSIVGEKKIDTNINKFGAIIGKNSKIGVNVTIFPGVKIGNNTFISPGEKVNKDVEDNKFFKSLDTAFSHQRDPSSAEAASRKIRK